MIDYEAEIVDMIAKGLYDEYGVKGIVVTSEPISTLQKIFPAVSVVERDNAILSRTRAMDNIENHAAVMYEIDIYSNLKEGKKQQAKEIAAKVNDILTSNNFTRIMSQPIDNIADPTIYRIKMRFRAIFGTHGQIYTT